jgi:hypothetical protein
MTAEELQAILKEEIPWSEQRAYCEAHPGCTVTAGLVIMSKYIKDAQLIEGAEHDVIYGPTFSDLAQAGITEEDAKTLRLLGWRDEGTEHIWFTTERRRRFGKRAVV